MASLPEMMSCGCWLLQYRQDLDPAVAEAYWSAGHGDIVASTPGNREYRQLHFSREDHGFWPVGDGLGATIPADWRMDGMPEVALGRALPSLDSARAMRAIFVDEQNAFERTLAHLTGPGGSRWFTGAHRDDVGVRAVVLLRRRYGLRPGAFRRFVHDELGPALLAGGATEVRTHVFLPGTRFLWWTPGLKHDNPPHRRYAAAVVIGAGDRDGLDRVIHSREVAATARAQTANCTGLHAYAVTTTVPRVIEGRLCATGDARTTVAV
jgi:hypothetical protein